MKVNQDGRDKQIKINDDYDSYCCCHHCKLFQLRLKMEGVGKCELTWEIQLTQAPPKGTGRPLSALDPAVSRGPRHLSRGWRGAGQRAARAGRRGRRERGRTGGPRPPTAQLSLLGSAGRAGPGVQQPPLQLLARIRRARSGRNHSPGGTGEGGARRADPGRPQVAARPPAPQRSRQVEAPGASAPFSAAPSRQVPRAQLS